MRPRAAERPSCKIDVSRSSGRGGRVVRQRSAKPPTWVRFPSAPPIRYALPGAARSEPSRARLRHRNRGHRVLMPLIVLIAQGVLHPANGILHLPLHLVGLALALELLV